MMISREIYIVHFDSDKERWHLGRGLILEDRGQDGTDIDINVSSA